MTIYDREKEISMIDSILKIKEMQQSMTEIKEFKHSTSRSRIPLPGS